MITGFVSDPIFEGRRNITLTEMAGQIRQEGKSADEVATRLLETNSARCVPPLDANEVRQIARSITRRGKRSE